MKNFRPVHLRKYVRCIELYVFHPEVLVKQYRD